MVSPKSSPRPRTPVGERSPQREHYDTVKSNPRKVIYAFVAIFTLGVIFYLGTSTSFSYSDTSHKKPSSEAADLSLDQWIESQVAISYDQLYQNLGHGSRARDAAAGAVIASPTTEHPDYYYQWVRDAAIVYKTIIDQYLAGNITLDALIDQWAVSQDAIQRTSNPSGDYHSGGIGEPKFQVDNSPFTGSWGRPQNDGPAIRATALMAYATRHALNGKDSHFMSFLYKNELPANSVIKADLEYVSHNWDVENFDLWEEVNGVHFFTLMVQLRSLLEGAAFASDQGDDGASRWYSKQAQNILIKLDQFWNPQGWIVSTLGRERARTGLDCGVILASLHGMSTIQRSYNPDSDKMLSTHFHYVKEMKLEYKLNSRSDMAGVAVGRYTEDIYDGYSTSTGNPWYLCTAAAAEQMYRATDLMEAAQAINVTNVSEIFFKQFLDTSKAGSVYTAKSLEYKTIIQGMRQHGDSFLSVIRQFAATNGSLSEQFNRNDGVPQGARDLTWSYGAFISAAQARKGKTVL